MSDVIHEKLEEFRTRMGADELQRLPCKWRGYDVYIPIFYGETPDGGSSKFAYVKDGLVCTWVPEAARNFVHWDVDELSTGYA